MNDEIITAVNKQLKASSPIFNKAVKSFYVASESGLLNPSDRVSFICDYEGTIRFISPSFSKIDCEIINALEKSILDFIHPEDVYPVIEHMVLLLQESAESVIVEARFLCKENQYYFTKWHVSYLRGLFYLYPIEVPELEKKKINQLFDSFQNNKSVYDKRAEQHIWKKELSKTLLEWDNLILKQLKFYLST